MLSIICQQTSQRLKYVCEIVFDQFLNIPYQLIPSEQFDSSIEDFVIIYGPLSSIPQSTFHIPSMGLIFE